jgi:glycerol-3-phosphate dehydrogenase (NAD(P)+)
VLRRAQEHGIEMPITAAVAAVLEGRMSPVEAVRALATRPAKHEAA